MAFPHIYIILSVVLSNLQAIKQNSNTPRLYS